MLACAASGRSAHLSQTATHSFDEYVERARATSVQSSSLWVDGAADRLRRVRSGEIVVAPVGENPHQVPDGLVHDWISAEFIPGATLDEVFAVIHDYDRYSEFYAPHVMTSRSLGHTGEDYRFALRLVNQSLLNKSALDSEYTESYVRLSDHSWYSVAYTTSIRQIVDLGDEDERKLPDGQGSGYLWRLFCISHFMERDGGVYVEMEVIALSRTIPPLLRWFVDPIVRRTAKSALEISMGKTKAAVNSQTAAGSRADEAKRAALPAAVRRTGS